MLLNTSHVSNILFTFFGPENIGTSIIRVSEKINRSEYITGQDRSSKMLMDPGMVRRELAA